MATHEQVINAILGKPSTPAPEQEQQRGLHLPCPKCGEASASVSLHLDDMTTFTCRECDEEFSTEDVQEFIARWQPVLAWINQSPVQ